MPFHTLDFGKDIVPLNGVDAFFLDTNTIIAYLYENNERHLACYNFITYLIKNDIMIYVNETVVGEVINSLARILYIDDQFEAYKVANGGLPATNKELRNLEYKFKTQWSNKVIKTEPTVLAQYNEIAIKMFKPFYSICCLVYSKENSLEKAMELCETTPLASSDAIITGTAVISECNGIITLDGDMEKISVIDVYTTAVTNEIYNSARMITSLDIQQFLIENLGEDEYKSKFNIAA
jgi:predicted nucleic acid-binding protein